MKVLRIKRLSGRLAVVVALALLWEIVSLLVGDSRLFPSWSYLVAVSLPSLGIFSNSAEVSLQSGLAVIAQHSLITLLRILAGVAIGVPAGVVAGLLFHLLRGEGPLSVAMLIFVRSTPLLALIPLFSFWFGASELGILAYVAFGVFVIVASDSYEAAANLPPQFLYQAHLLGGGRLFIVRSVYLPAIGQQFLSTIRNVVGLSWVFALGAEYISAQSGLGYITYQSYLYADMGKLVVLCICYMVFGSVMAEATTKFVSARLPWISLKG